VVFKYKVSDVDGYILNCSLYSNIGGTWGLKQTQYAPISEGVTNEFIVEHVPLGMTYRWNVTCVDNDYMASTSVNAPLGYWTVSL
jgi:hypothetical protein